MLFAALVLTLIVQATDTNSCETLCHGKCGKDFGREKCGVKAMGSNGDCTCYDGTTFPKLSKRPEKKEECICVTEWEDAGCTGKQKGCPKKACDDDKAPRWCVIANEGCATEKEDGGWAECDDYTPVVGQECVNDVAKLRGFMYDEEATCESAYFDLGGSDICKNKDFKGVCCATCADPPKTCDCGIDAVKGEEKFQSGSVDGDKMCQWGTNCATFSEGCDTKGAKICYLKIEYKREKKCTDCSCNRWDGSNYSSCRLVTPSRECNGYCVKCESDGMTPMKGLYTKHPAECARYEGGVDLEEEEEVGSSMENTWEPEPEPTENPLCSVGNGCCNQLGDEHCNMFADYCHGEENQNVRDGCALMCGQCVPEKKCTACNCYHWDGKNYSNCRLVTDERPCTAYCVQCQIDGKTPMPGLYTTHNAECAKYEGDEEEEEVGSSMETEEENGSSMETFWDPEPETTQNPLCSVGNGCCNLLGDEHCNMFAGFCHGEDNQNVRDGCALMCGQCVPEKKCTNCDCTHWDGHNYSACRLVTDDRPCHRYCVKCQNDGKTPMPGLYTKHNAECANYEGGLAFAEAHVTVADMTAQDFAVYGFAVIGLGFLLYGAGKHYWTTKAYNTIPTTLEADV